MNHTPGPWKWRQSGKDTFLSTPDRGLLTVMDFVRCGMNSGQPRFAVWDGEERERLGGLMKKAEDFTNLYDHPDARLIAAAPEMLKALEASAEADAHFLTCEECEPHSSICEEQSKLLGHAGDLRQAALELVRAPHADRVTPNEETDQHK